MARLAPFCLMLHGRHLLVVISEPNWSLCHVAHLYHSYALLSGLIIEVQATDPPWVRDARKVVSTAWVECGICL